MKENKGRGKGRPRQKVKKSKVLNFRVTEEEKARIDLLVEKDGGSLSVLILKRLFYSDEKYFKTHHIEPKDRLNLIQIGNNLNQISRHLNIYNLQKNVDFSEFDFREMKEEMDLLKKEILHIVTQLDYKK